MIVTIRDYTKSISFKLCSITQLCGQNMVRKSFVIESLRRYYSGGKYAEDDSRWRDNVYIDGTNTGRKYFSISLVSSKESLISTIKLTKQSIMMEYLRLKLTEFENQRSMLLIGDELDKVFDCINQNLNTFGSIEITYEPSKLWEIIQQSTIEGINGKRIEDISSAELINVYISLVEELQKNNPNKSIVIFENIDHLVTKEEYKDIVDKTKLLADKYDVYFIFSVSLIGYPVVRDTLLEGITVINEEIFGFPAVDYLLPFVNENYPIYREYESTELISVIEGIVQNIGMKIPYMNKSSLVVYKMLNRSLMIDESIDISASQAEICFLK